MRTYFTQRDVIADLHACRAQQIRQNIFAWKYFMHTYELEHVIILMSLSFLALLLLTGSLRGQTVMKDYNTKGLKQMKRFAIQMIIWVTLPTMTLKYLWIYFDETFMLRRNETHKFSNYSLPIIMFCLFCSRRFLQLTSSE